MSNLFISHSSRDNEAAKDLKARLEARGHRSLFLDLDPEKGIQAGVSWERTLYTKLRACRAVVALCSHNYLASHWCFAELALARMEGKAIFALQIEPWKTGGEDATKMPSILTESQYVDLRTDPDGGYERLWHAFKVHGIVPAEHREWGPQDPPYPGLRAFEEQDAPIFFGREPEVQEGVELLTRVRRQGHPRLAMVLGASGSGKSSLARAGIVPQLRRDPTQWLVVEPFRPGAQPALKLAYALSRKFEEIGRPRSEEEILDLLEPANAAPPAATSPTDSGREPAAQRLLEALEAFEKELSADDAQAAESLHRLRAVIRGRPAKSAAGERPARVVEGGPLAALASQLQRGSETSVVLVIDQFEELLGHADEAPDRPHPANRFLLMLRAALDAEGSPLVVLATMRSDFLEPFQQSPALLGVGFKKLSLGPMSREGMRQVIKEPAKLGHIELEKGLADLLLDETGTSDALPLLAFTLRVMWDRYIDESDRLLAIREYRELGGLQGAMAQVADETLEAALRKGDEGALRDAFLSLARPAAEGSGWSRQPASWDSLASVQPMIQHFVDQRLLVTRPDGTVEVAHEALFRAWETLRGWLSENAEALHLRREIGIGAQKWKEAREEEKELYFWRKGRLQRAIELRDEGRLAFGEGELDFLRVAEEAESRERLRKRRRLQALLAAATAAALVMTVLAILAWIGQRRAQIQAAKALTIQVRGPGYPLDQSLLIAVETSRTLERLAAPGQLYEARTTLLAKLLAYPQLDTFLHGHRDQISTISSSADGSLLASGGADGRLVLWRDGRPLWNLDHCAEAPRPPDDLAAPCDHRVRRVAFSPLGDRLVSSADKGVILVWDTATGQLAARLETPTPAGGALAVGGDGRVLSGDFKGRVRLWTIADRSHAELGVHPEQSGGEPAWVSQVAFTSDGRVLSASVDQTLRLWETSPSPPDGGGSRILCQGDSAIYGLRVSSSGLVAAGFANGSLRLWREEELLAEPRPGAGPPPTCSEGAITAHEGEIRDVAFSPDGQLLASAAFEEAVKLWATDDLSEAAQLAGHSRGAWSVDVGRDGRVATGAGDGKLRLWNVARAEPRFKQTAHDAALYLVAIRGEELVATGDAGGAVRLTRLPDLADGPLVFPRPGEVTGLAFDPGGRYLATAIDYTVYLWDLATLERAAPALFEDTRHEAWIWGLAFSPDGRQFASFDHGGNVWLRRVPAGEARHLLGPGSEACRAAGDGGAGRRSPCSQTSVGILAFAPTGETAVFALGREDGSVETWSAETGALLAEFPGHTKRLVALAFRPDGLEFATGGADNAVWIWSMHGRHPPRVLRDHEAQLGALVYSPDGRRIASADVEGWIRVWDAESGVAEFGLKGHRDDVHSLAFTEGGWLVSSGQDRTIRRWEIGLLEPLESAYERACRLANRNLDRAEWEKFFGHESYRETCPELAAPAP